MKEQYRIRKKGTYADGSPKWVVEKREYSGWKGRTLPPPKELFEMVCPDTIPEIVSQSDVKSTKKGTQNFAQYLLTEPEESPKKRTPTEEEIKYLKEITK